MRLFRQSTVAAGGHSCVKDLSPLGRDLRRTVLVDNSPFSFLLQPACGVPAHPFDGDGADEHLLSSVLPLLRELAADPRLDVRPLLSARFGMASWLAARGGWALYEAPCGNLAVATGYCAPPASSSSHAAAPLLPPSQPLPPPPPSTPERRKGGGGFVAEEAEEVEEDAEFEDSSQSSSSWRPSTPTTPQAQEHQQRPSSSSSGRPRPLGAAVSVDSPSVVVEEEERMMAIEVAA